MEIFFFCFVSSLFLLVTIVPKVMRSKLPSNSWRKTCFALKKKSSKKQKSIKTQIRKNDNILLCPVGKCYEMERDSTEITDIRTLLRYWSWERSDIKRKTIFLLKAKMTISQTRLENYSPLFNTLTP